MLVVGLVSVANLTLAATAASGANVPYFTLTVTPSHDLVDGEAMTVTVTRTAAGAAAGLQINSIGTGWCTTGFQVPPELPASFYPNTYSALPQITGPNAHCTTHTHPLNGDLTALSAISPPYNPSGTYPTVTGTVDAESSGGTTLWTGSFTLVCDAAHPCTFVVAVFTDKTSVRATTKFLSLPVTYLPSTFSADCGGAAPGQLTTAGPDRLGQQVTNWTIAACAASVGGGKALTQNLASGQSDGSALADFASGSADLVYSAVGYTATATFTPLTARPFVAVPIAINAVVLAHIESAPLPNAADNPRVFTDYPQLDITPAQAAALLGGGPNLTALLWSSPLGKALVRENPSLGTGWYHTSTTVSIVQNESHNNQKPTVGVVATSLNDATTLFATTYFHTVVPNDMISATKGQVLGVTSDFGTADPPFGVIPATGLEIFTKDLRPGHGQGFALTNAATAAATWGGMADFAMQSTSSIGSATPSYVAPTTASMQAAVSEMIPQPDGMLEPNPDATATKGVVAYPLTFVEYAIAPTQPLLNANCTPRTDSQQDLIDWLNYLVGPGQGELVKGLAPLTSELQKQARAAIAQVGKSTPTGPCAPVAAPAAVSPSSSSPSTSSRTSATAPTSSNGTVSAATPRASGLQSSSVLSSTGTTSAAAARSMTARSATKAAEKGAATQTSKPLSVDLAGLKESTGSGLAPVLGVLFLILLLPGLALLVSRRSSRRVPSAPAEGPAATGGAAPDAT